MKKIYSKTKFITASVVMTMALSACGGGSDDGNSSMTSSTNPTTPANIECVNGIPENLKTSGSGSIFSEEIFSLEYDFNDKDEDSLAFYTNKLINGVIYQNLTSLIKNGPSKIDTTNYIEYYLTRSHLNTSFKQTLTSSGFPLGYAVSQNQESVLLNQFNDKCTVHSENQIQSHIKTIDISGKTVADLFKYYEYPQAGNPERYLSSNIPNILDNEKDSLAKLLQDTTKFPQGSKISYIDQSIFIAPRIIFSENNLTQFRSIDEFKNNTTLPKGYSWKNDQFANYNVAYPIIASTGQSYPFTENYAVVEMNGKIYAAAYLPEGDLIKQQMDPSETHIDMSETYFNKTAMQTFADAVNKVL